ncbi:acyl-CoA dehydrogenase family protein [Caldimonas brevitalea]|uniref:Acyl-CoA dehydrogenase n=1 Tax=Caldimonas brevitalea TaxID=413882 RepID=A0A0G3BM89_9BURK|nr:acyl-CoA dehydrogenase family protein [Caldimonas brevitalea]AKJ30554.1 acyl-CoA dehydrogenase [Caldimonas brevitalea]
MNFNLTEEQQLLDDTVRRFVAKEYGLEQRRAVMNSASGWSREVWGQLADMGLLALHVPEAHGGLDAGAVETLVVMQALGQGLALEPFLASAVIATELLRSTGDDAQQAAWLPALASGERVAVLAHDEAPARGIDLHVDTRAHRTGDGYVLNGHKSVVLHAGAADVLLVSARTHGEADQADGVSLFLVPRDTPSVVLREYRTVDGQRAADVQLNGTYVAASGRLGAEGGAWPAIQRALDIGLAALCAEAVGVIKAVVDATIEYLQTRKQFGQPIGRFQALQHRAADLLMHYEQAKSMSIYAAVRCRHDDAAERAKALSAAKVVIGRACRFVSQQAVQLHGGMGVTDELVVSHQFKRLMAIELSLGDTDAHLQRYSELSREGRLQPA